MSQDQPTREQEMARMAEHARDSEDQLAASQEAMEEGRELIAGHARLEEPASQVDVGRTDEAVGEDEAVEGGPRSV